MIGDLPEELEIGGKLYGINADYRIALLIFQAFEDPNLTEQDKAAVCIQCLFDSWQDIPYEHIEETIHKACWFLNGGDMPMSHKKVKIYDWEQDERMIFSAVNKSAGFEVRNADFLHWWTFLGYFSEAGEGLLSTVMNIRYKKAKGKKLDKTELEFIREHRELIEIKHKLSREEQEENDFVNGLFK